MKKGSPTFTPIDMQTWARKPYFDQFYQTVKCTYSVTVNIDISLLLAKVKKAKSKFYPSIIYIISRAINQFEELRTNFDANGKLGVWDVVSPSYTIFHEDDKKFSSIWTPYEQDFSSFHRSYLEDVQTYGNVKSFLPKGEDPPNCFYISCIPWLDFTAFNLNIHDDARHLAPIFTIGKYTQHKGKTVIPVSAQFHHALVDGYHAGLLFEAIKALCSKDDIFLNAG